jgi:non-ribosomal peptide synthase protein (TIGR01720 family)
LGRERIGAGDHFFSLGGDSIKALQVVSRLRQAGLRLELRDLFLNPVLSALAPRLKPLVVHPIDHDSNAADVPLGPVQAAFLHHYPGPKHHFHQALLLAPREAVNVDALNRAIAAVYAHHDALRMRFTFTKGTWVQSCGDAHTPPVAEVVDLSRAASGNDALAAHAAVAMAATDLARGPLFIACVYRLADCERVLLAAHHLVVDGVSWRIVIEDLDAAYEQACAQRAVSLTPVADTYARWAAGMRRLAVGLTEDERSCWDRAEQATSGRLPLDAPEAQASQRDRVERRIALAPEVAARLLTSAHDAYGTRMDDLLLAALGRALVAWCGGGRWQVLLESHGREPLWDGSDVSRTAGWFTARYPVVLDVEGPDDVGRQIKGVKEMLRGVPHGGGTYEAVRHLTGSAAPGAPLPAIAFNYLGQLGRELRTDHWTWVDEPTGAVIAPGAPLVHDLEIIGFVADDRLHVAIGYGSVRFSEATVARLAAALECALIEIVEHTTHKQDRELTPSDIDYDGFDIDTLDAFVKNL